MQPQSSISRPSGHRLPLGGSSCPTCDQDIPPEKLEEISGRITVRMREQEQSLRATMEKRFDAERALANSKAANQLEEVKQQAAARIEAVRDETQKAADLAAAEKLAAVQQCQEEARSRLQLELDKAEKGRLAALEERATLGARAEKIQQEADTKIAELKAAAAEREKAIRQSTEAEVKAAVAQEMQTLRDEFAARASTLQQEIEAGGQRVTALQAQLKQTADEKAAEIAQIKAEAAAAEACIRGEAQQTAKQQIAERDQTIADVQTRLDNSEEQRSKALTEFTAMLTSQREAMEKARDEAVCVEKARAFDDNQKLLTQINELQRKLEKKTNEELGEGAEVDLYEALKAAFPEDEIKRVGKGQAGADIIHRVMHNSEECGVIIYDSKNHKQFRSDHVTKLRSDQLAGKADHAILSALKLPEGTRQLHVKDGVLIANPARVTTLAMIVRQHVIQVHTLRVSAADRETKTLELYDFMTSDRFRQITSKIDGDAETLLELQATELKQHEKTWKKQGQLYRDIQKTTATLMNVVAGIVGAAAATNGEAETEAPADLQQ